MEVVSACPLRVGSITWQTRPGVFVLTVVAKATFALLPVESRLAPEQDQPHEADQRWDDDGRRSLRAASDLAPFKRRADVFVVGHAHAPRGRPARSLTARFLLGDVDKAVEVHADRVFNQRGELLPAAPFARMPLSWERAAAGPSNPVGMRPEMDRLGQIALPNLQVPGLHVSGPGDTVLPVGVGPIAPEWPGRAMHLREHGRSFDHRRWSDRPLPEGIDAAYFNAAPPDQQVLEIRGDERLVLENLHPDHPRLVTSLPGIVPEAMVQRYGAMPAPLQLTCDTLDIDTDRGVCHLVWRGRVMLADPDEAGLVVIGTGHDSALDTLPGISRAAASLPFQPGPEAARPPSGPPPGGLAVGFRVGASALGALPVEEEPAPETLYGARQAAVVLPFIAAASPPEPPLPRIGPLSDGLPFAPVAAAPRPPPPAPVFMLPALPPEPAPPAPVFTIPALPPEPAPPAPVFTIPALPPEPPPPPRPAPSPPPPPPLPEPALPAPEAPAEPPPLPIDDYPLPRCAAIAASLARRPPEKAAILEAQGLDPAVHARLAAHWEEAVAAETKRGRGRLLGAYDAAYVGQLEKERGPITPEEHARLVVAAERGQVEEACRALDLPAEAFMRVRRLWIGRGASDPQAGAAARKALAAERERD